MTLRKGDVCFANLSGGFGHEQSGVRPAVVLAATDTRIVVVVPVTSNREALRFSHTFSIRAAEGNGLTEDSVALLFHIRAIDARRVEKVCGRVDAVTQAKLDTKLRRLLGL